MKTFLQHLMEAPMTTGAGNGSQRTSQRSGNYHNPKDAFEIGGGFPEPAIIKPGGPLDGSAYQPGAGPGDGSIPSTFSARPLPGYERGDRLRPVDYKPPNNPGYDEFWEYIETLKGSSPDVSDPDRYRKK